MSAVLDKHNELPEGWSISSISEVATISTGKRDANHATEDGEYKFFTCAFEPLAAPTYAFDDEALLLPGNGHNVGEVFYYKGKLEAYQRTYVLHEIKVEPKYLFYNLKLGWRKATAEKQYGTATNYIRMGNFTDYTLPIAPPEQQKRIVAKIEELFSHIDAGIEALKKAKQLLKQYRQSVLKAAVTGGLTKEWREANKGKLEPASQLLERILKERRQKWEEQQLEQFKTKGKMPKDDKWKERYTEPVHDVDKFFEEPDGWAWTEIGTITDMLSGHAFKKAEYSDSGVRLFKIANVSFGHTKWDEIEHLPESYLNEWGHLELKEGDVLMALNRPLLSKQLKISRLGKGDVPAILYQRVGKFQFYTKNISDYFLLYMQSHYYINKLEEQLQGVNIPFINKGKLLETSISIPAHEEEVILIVESANKKLDSIKRLEIEIDKQMNISERNKQTILAAAFSGKLIKDDQGDESAKFLLDNLKKEVIKKRPEKTVKSRTKKREGQKKASEVKLDLIGVIQKEFGEDVFSINELFDVCERDDLSELKSELFDLLKNPRKGEYRLDMQFDDNAEQYIFRLILRSSS